MAKPPPSEWIVTGEGRESVFTPFSNEGLNRFMSLDKSFIGTQDYMGHAYFWSPEYKFVLRSASLYQRRLIHKRLCMAGLEPDGESDDHEKIIQGVLRTPYLQGE